MDLLIDLIDSEIIRIISLTDNFPYHTLFTDNIKTIILTIVCIKFWLRWAFIYLFPSLQHTQTQTYTQNSRDLIERHRKSYGKVTKLRWKEIIMYKTKHSVEKGVERERVRNSERKIARRSNYEWVSEQKGEIDNKKVYA